MEEEEDTYPEKKRFSQLWPLPRLRSQSDVSGFRCRILFKLRGARSGMTNSFLMLICNVQVMEMLKGQIPI